MRTSLLASLVAILLALGGCAVPEEQAADVEPLAEVTQSKTVTPEPEPEPEPTSVAVPDLVGQNVEEATQALEDSSLTVGRVEREPSDQPVGSVLEQGIAAGVMAELGSEVALVVAAPMPRIPDVTGMAEADATQTLRDAGFRVRTTTKTGSSGNDGSVLSMEPGPGTRAMPGTLVRVVVLNVVQTFGGGGGGSNCTPGYSPCLEPASDYDCAGGSGDGPEYVDGPIQVTGDDRYDLDRDGDGVACDT